MDGKVWMSRSCKSCSYHGDENGDYYQASDDPENTKHSSESGLWRAIAVAAEKQKLSLLK